MHPEEKNKLVIKNIGNLRPFMNSSEENPKPADYFPTASYC